MGGTSHDRISLGFASSALLIAALLAPAQAAQPLSRTQVHGVTVDIHRTPDGITFCLNAQPNIRIAAEYGIELKVPAAERNLWSEPLPKLVARSETYFDLPLGIDLKSAAALRKRRVTLRLGICVDGNYCTPIEIPLIVAPGPEAPVATGCGP